LTLNKSGWQIADSNYVEAEKTVALTVSSEGVLSFGEHVQCREPHLWQYGDHAVVVFRAQAKGSERRSYRGCHEHVYPPGVRNSFFAVFPGQ
jgi:hypothetical protein